MPDTNEPLSAILAEMHAELDCIDDTKVIPVVYIKNRLPRIEAAAERERNAHTNDIHDALYMATGIPGNAAALREALNRVGHLANDLRNITERDTEVRADVNEIVDVCRAALATPARNCDRFADELDAQLAFLNDVWLISVDKNTMLEKDKFENWTEQMKTRYGRWLLAPAEGGDHA